MEPKVTTPVVKGLIVSLLFIVLGIILHLSGQSRNTTLGYINLLLMAVAMVVCTIIYVNQMKGNVTFGNAFAHGFKTTAVVLAISSLYAIVSIKIIFPEIVDMAVSAAEAELRKGNLSDEQQMAALEMTRKMILPFALGGVILGYGVSGAIGAAIGAGVAKKNPVTPFN